MKIDLSRVYSKIDDIIASYTTNNFRFKNSGKEIEKEYAKEIKECFNNKVNAIKDIYKQIKKDIHSFEDCLSEMMNLVFIKAAISSQIDYYDSSINLISDKIADIDLEIEKNNNRMEELKKELNDSLKGNFCNKNLELVNLLNDKKYKCYYDSIELCEEYDQILEVNYIKNEFNDKILRDPKAIEKVDQILLEIGRIKRRNNKVYYYKSAYYRLKKKNIDEVKNLKEERRSLREKINGPKDLLINSLYDSYLQKTIDIIYKSILISSKNDYEECAKLGDKRRVIKSWIYYLINEGVSNE